MKQSNVAIIGGGIVGLATAYKLASHYHANVTVLEKEERVGMHQSGNNSGVMHAGLSYLPGSLKAELAISGIKQMRAFCAENGIPHEVCGKLVVATQESELPLLQDLMSRGQRNGLKGLRWLNQIEIKEIEPHATGMAALLVPEEGIVDYSMVCSKLVTKIQELGGRVLTGAKALAFKLDRADWVTETEAGEVRTHAIVNCAGLHSDRVAMMTGERTRLRIVPFRGQYYKLRENRSSLIRNLIYPVPNPAFPFLGVHFTRQITGGIEAGPNASLAFAREGYDKSTISLRDLADASSFPGLWRFVLRYPRVCAEELGISFSRNLFCRALQRLVPEVEADDLISAGAGVRAQAILPNGLPLSDFHFVERRRTVHVLNAPSPGATASLAIGDVVARRLHSQLN